MKFMSALIIFSFFLFSCSEKPEIIIEDPVPSDGQHVDISVVLGQFIPDGYEILDSMPEDINGDGTADMLLILKHKDEGNIDDEMLFNAPRPFILLTGNSDRTFSFAARNDNVILCQKCGGAVGDPYVSAFVEDGKIIVDHFGGASWRWSKTAIFEYNSSESRWVLAEYIRESYHPSDPVQVQTVHKTKKDFGLVYFEDFNIYDE
ncbi:MAG: hypothetical protein KIT33_14955 [Candidatus Kapabacteria bacterium]|nr:hypothetical protein [Ignavibacteriota bacterium]MCW5886268.1 hypothetical protein [Candidatus Kapabacteria bacterium]